MIVRKTVAEIEKMRAAGHVVAEILAAIEHAIIPGVTRTKDLDLLAVRISERHGAVPAFLGYRGYPASTCVSVNEAVVHGIPGDQILKNGDLVSVDFACSMDGHFADAAVTLPVGEVSAEARRLLLVTRQCLHKGVAQARVGARLGDVASAIQRHAESAGYGIVRDLVGHGIGRALHEEPEVPNVGRTGKGVRLVEGMTLAIEPMINEGGAAVEALHDNWTIVTADGKLSAHFEHTVAITKRGPDILTLRAAPVLLRGERDEQRARPVVMAGEALIGRSL
jgi:methionyl aminopeptidase